MFNEINSNEIKNIINKICKKFDITVEEFDEINNSTSNFIKKYYEHPIKAYSYLDCLNKCIDYCQFGADKCAIGSFKAFCKELDIDYNHQIPSGVGYQFCSKNRDLTFTCSSSHFMDGHLHYFGVSGSKEAVIKAFDYFYENASFEGLCWGFRDYI